MTAKGSTGAARGFVCAKHEEFCPDGVCRWCGPAQTRAGTAAATTCRMRDYQGALVDAGGVRRCGRPAAWEWRAVTEHAKRIDQQDGLIVFCRACHDLAIKDGGTRALQWQFAAIATEAA